VAGRFRKVAAQTGIGLPAEDGRTSADALDALLELSLSEDGRGLV
jgi:hypothetical protein